MIYQSLLNKNKILLFLFFSLLLRIIYSYFFGWQEIPPGSDGPSYNRYAIAILNQADWITNPDYYGDFRPPAYPIFLAIIYSIFGIENFFAVYFFQAILTTLIVYYIYKLSTSIFGELKSYVALFWAGFYFFYTFYTAMILRETFVHFLIIFSFYHLWGFLEKNQQAHFPKSIDLWKFIVAFTILCHTDAKYLFYIPFISILFIIYKNFWIGIKQYLWVLLMLIFLMLPWITRNYIAYNQLVLINTKTSGRVSWVLTTIVGRDTNTKKITFRVTKDYPSEEERALVKQGKNPKNRTPEEIAIIKKDVYPPSTPWEKRLYRFKEMWIPFRFWYDYEWAYDTALMGPWSLKHNLASILFYGTLIPFLFYALFNLFRTRQKAVWFLISPILIHALLHFLAWGRERHRIQIDAFIIILGCYGMVVIYEYIKLNLFLKKSI